MGMDGIAGKAAIVTGAAMGIGEQVARRLAAEGARVLLFDRDGDQLARVAADISTAGGTVVEMRGDVAEPGDAAAAVAAAVDAFGGVDLLANIAGILRFASVEETDVGEWRRVMDVNVGGPLNFTAAAIPEMRRRGGGAIVNTASTLAFVSTANAGAYCASKAAVWSLTMTSALEGVADGIRVNAVAPGNVHTPMMEANAKLFSPEDIEGALAAYGSASPIGRLIAPDRVANAIAFLLSDEALDITGTCLRVDGGHLARLSS